MYYAYNFGPDGRVISTTMSAAGPPALVGELVYITEDQAIGEANPLSLVATIEDGGVVSVAIAPQAPELWLHVALAGGSLSPDGVRYLAHGQELLVAAVMRETAEADSLAVTHLAGQHITYAWAMELMDRSGVVRDCPLVQVVEGASSVVYTAPDGYYGYLILDESSFAAIGPYRVRLVGGPIVLKIVRALA